MSEPLEMRVLTSRVGYEYRLDDLRLTMLCTDPVIQHLAEAFQFKAASLTTPGPTFGPVQNTLPAGLVFQMGAWIQPDDSQIVPIRFLNIEPQRIVVDVAGPSTVFAGIYDRLKGAVTPITAPDGYPIIGEPWRILHYSEVSIRLPFALDEIFRPRVSTLFRKHTVEQKMSDDFVLVPSLQFRMLPSTESYTGDISIADGHTFSLSLRASTTPGEHAIFSSAPLETGSHFAFINELVQALLPEQKKR